MPRLPFVTMIASLILGLGPDVLLAQQAGPAIVPGGVEPLPYLDRLPPLVDREVFFGNPEISGGELSPDGRWVSFIKPLDGIRNVWVKAIDEPFEAARPMTADSTRPVQGYFWSQDSRVILFVQDQGGNENFHVYSVDPSSEPAAGSQVPPALDLTPLDDVRASIYAVPENDPSHILVGLNDRDAAVHDVYRIDITTGERKLVLQNDENVAQWVADLDGNLRLGVRQTEDGGWEILRIDGDALTQIYACGSEETCFPDRFHKDGKRVYLQTNKGEGDLVRLELMDATTGATELVESDPDGEVDFGGTIFSNRTEELIGTFYTGDRTRYYPKTDEFARDLERVKAALPEGDYGFRSMTEDGRLMLVSVDSDVDPSSTYVFHRESGDAELLYRVRPDVPIEHMATMKPVRYTARADGAVTGEIQAGPQTLPVDVQTEGAVFSNGPALELGLSTLPLEPGTSASIQLFEVLEGKVKPFRVEVMEPEKVVTPAGTFEVAPVALTPLDGSSGGQTVYVDTAEPHRVVKVDAKLPAMMGGGTATAVLAQ